MLLATTECQIVTTRVLLTSLRGKRDTSLLMVGQPWVLGTVQLVSSDHYSRLHIIKSMTFQSLRCFCSSSFITIS